jgi:hypothetical protein
MGTEEKYRCLILPNSFQNGKEQFYKSILSGKFPIQGTSCNKIIFIDQ